MKFCFDSKDFIEVDTNSNKLAVIGDDFELTWAEFRTKVNETVDSLITQNLEHLASPVIIYGHKSANMMVAAYAMMKLNIAYIPVDLIYPTDRILKIIATADCQLIINTTINSLEIDNISELVITENNFKFKDIVTVYKLNEIKIDPLVYIIFTSGSTGEPKGVQISTEAVQSFGRWMSSSDFGFTANDTFINTALLSFDLSVFEVMTFGYIGGTILLNSKVQCSDPNILMDRINTYKGNIWVSTPSFAITYSRIEDTALLNSIHTFLFCGEILPHPLAKTLVNNFSRTKIINTYGPTEATVATTIVEITPEIIETYNPLPVGVAKMESKLLIEDNEIIIIGPNVSKGYVKNDTLNKEKFVTISNQRAFKTGDNGYFEDGLLFFNGRNDDLVKLHGFRIELNEITSALIDLDYISQAETIALKRNGVVKKIVSLVQLKPNINSDKAIIIFDLAKILPPYMLPADIKIIDSIPLNQNGKSDKKMLTKLYLKR